MVKPFRLARVPQIILRNGALADLPSIAASYGRNILLVTGAKSFFAAPGANNLPEKFLANGLTIFHVTVPGEPSPAAINEATARFREAVVDLVVSIGGGSVMDAGKAISAMLTAEGSVTDYLEVVGKHGHPGTKVPFIAIPTTSGTGSEATKNAVISQVGKDGFKRSLRHENFVPDLALIDPELTLNCPPEITAAAGMDCFTQLAEAYLSTKANEFTDALALRGIEAISRSLVRSYTDGDDIDARSDMSFAALMSGICLANAGLGAVHGLAGTIGALHGIPHGVVCGTLMAAANKLNVRELRRLSQAGSPTGEFSASGISATLGKYATLGRIFADASGRNDDWYIDFFIDYLHAVTYRLSIPRLSSYGLEKEDLQEIVNQSDVKNNPVKLADDHLTEILNDRL